MAAAVPIMPFLRPLSQPRLSSLRSLLRASPSIPCQRRYNASIASTTSSGSSQLPPIVPSRPKVPVAIKQRQSQTIPEPKVKPPPPGKLPYHVVRTKSQNLPVYGDVKRGGMKKIIVIRKIVGDSKALASDVTRDLELPEENVTVNHLTKHVVIKIPTGRDGLMQNVKAYLEGRNM